MTQEVSERTRLEPGLLWHEADLSAVEFETTDDLEPLSRPPGQERARDALEFGIDMAAEGYNLFAMGSPETEIRDLVGEVIDAARAARTPAQDWCYTGCFGNGDKARVIGLPRGRGVRFRDAMQAFVDDLKSVLPGMFTTDEFRSRMAELGDQFARAQRTDVEELQHAAEAKGLVMLQTPGGFAFAPARDGKVLEEAEFESLSAEEKAQVAETIDELNAKLIERMQSVPIRQQQLAREQKALFRQFSEAAVGDLIRELRREFSMYPEILGYLDDVGRDVVDHAPVIVRHEDPATSSGVEADRFFARYSVNLLVTHGADDPVPVVVERNPSIENLVGRIEMRPWAGESGTDFTMIRAGALHRANGGYLIVDAESLLMKPFAWDALKRALLDGQIHIEGMSHYLSLGYTVALDPDPIPLRVKVVLTGSRELYYLLSAHDRDFPLLFRVVADLDERLPRDASSESAYAHLVAGLVGDAKLLPVDRAGVTRLIDESSRRASDSGKLSTHTRFLRDVLAEADYLARRADAETITGTDIDAAITRQVERLSRVRVEVHEAINDGTIIAATTGTAVGQVNGLSVLQIGAVAFGQPSRVTATARMGQGEMIDIEREAKLSGKIHSKGTMIVSSFIGARYARELPLSLRVSLVFEQSYGGIDGDSASVAEVIAIVSALTGLPARQDLAVTGSLDQHGRVQAIGGANEKIEGFFDVCAVRGLTGSQGIVMPADNTRHLMVAARVRDALQASRFNVYAISSIDDALALFFDLEAGVPDAEGAFPPDSVNGRVVAAIQGFSTLARDRARELSPKGESS